jgi:hypothetical protein
MTCEITVERDVGVVRMRSSVLVAARTAALGRLKAR